MNSTSILNSAIVVTTLLLCSCASNSHLKSTDTYVVSQERNDIKEKHPELWQELVSKGKKINKRNLEEIGSVDYQFELNRAVASIETAEGMEKAEMISGLWRNCSVQTYKESRDSKVWKTQGEARVIEFTKDSKFRIYNQYFSSQDCLGKPLYYESLNCGGEKYSSDKIERFAGHYYIGNLKKSKEGVDVYEINMIHQDMPCSKNYSEERVYFTIVEVKDKYINFGSRTEGGGERTPLKRKKILDKSKFRYYKQDQHNKSVQPTDDVSAD